MKFSIALLFCTAAFAQDPNFEVASVKPAGAFQPGRPVGMRGGPGTNDPGQISWNFITLQDLILRAYDLKEFQISAPSWISSERYDVTAKIPAGTEMAQFRIMLQNLLATRFQLKVHRETRQIEHFDLVVAKNGPRFKESPPESASAPPAGDPNAPAPTTLKHGADGIIELPASMHGKGHIAIRSFRGVELRVRGESLDYLVDRLTAELHKTVVDKTGLKGHYDYALAYLPETLANSQAENLPPDLFTALQSTLGLKLESQKSPGEVLVIDHVEKVPTEN